MTLGFIWLAASAGALSLLTPCVFPMVPITVSYFTQPRRRRPAHGACRHALVFGLGIVATLHGARPRARGVRRRRRCHQSLAGNPWVNLLLTAIFVGFALNLFGVYQIAFPSSWLTALDNVVRRQGAAGQGVGVLGALLMGLTFTLTSFTCTAPFVGTVLVTAAQGNWHWPLAGHARLLGGLRAAVLRPRARAAMDVDAAPRRRLAAVASKSSWASSSSRPR